MTAIAIDLPSERIAVWRSIGRAYATVFENLGPLLKIAALPLLLYMLLPIATIPISALIMEQIGRLEAYNALYVLDSAGLEDAIDQILRAIPVTLFCSHWLQFLAALGPTESRSRVLIWSRRDLEVLRYFPLFLIAPLLVFLWRVWNALPDSVFLGLHYYAVKYGYWIMEAEFWGPLAMIVVLNAAANARFGPALAIAAIGTGRGLRDAWRITHGQTWRLIFLWLALCQATFAVAFLIQSKINTAYSELLDRGFDPSFGALPADNTAAWEAVWQILQLPHAALTFIAFALVMTVYLRVYRASVGGQPTASQDILERFE